MKELTIEQKAKAYDEAIERAREVINNNPDFVRVTPQLMEEIFPELAESEDERIRKAIINTIEDCSPILSPEVQKRMIAWLEKQGERKFNKCSEDDIRIKDRLVSIIKEIKRQPLVRLEDWDGYIAWLEKQCEKDN